MKFQQHFHQEAFPLALNLQTPFVQIRTCTIINSPRVNCNVGNLFNTENSSHACKWTWVWGL